MDFKKDVQNWLDSLEKIGYGREEVGAGIGRTAKYITEQLSKADNQTFYKTIKRFHDDTLLKARFGNKNKEDVILEMSVRQVALSRVLLRGISEILGALPGKSVTGVTGDLDRAVKEEFQKLKDELASGASF